jgi:hypothetical protein
MDVVVGIDVVRWPAGQVNEGGELAVELPMDPIEVRGVEEPFPARIERHVNADAEVRPLPRLSDGRLGIRAIHHEAGTGDDAAVVGLEDSAIDLRGHPEIVRVDDCEALPRIGAGWEWKRWACRPEQGPGARPRCRLSRAIPRQRPGPNAEIAAAPDPSRYPCVPRSATE